MCAASAEDVDTNPAYWEDYSPLQHVKHALIRSYLGGWFAKLGSWAGRVVYVDTHAGRGRHATGDLGSPLVALDTLLSHRARDRLLRSSEFEFHFIERDEANRTALLSEIARLGPLPRGIVVRDHAGDSFAVLRSLLGRFEEIGSSFPPAFVFVDPYGFRIPGAVLRDLMRAGRVELFVNLMWRELRMTLARAPSEPGHAVLADLIFGGPDWRTEIRSGTSDEQAEEATNLLARKVGSRWPTYIRMLGDNQDTRYLLLHLTNHDEGRDLMKDCMWKACPDGGFRVRKTEDPAQQFLITPTPDLRPLRSWLMDRLGERPRRWQDLLELARPTVWRDAHVNSVVRELRRQDVIVPTEYSGKFLPSANPLLSIQPDHT